MDENSALVGIGQLTANPAPIFTHTLDSDNFGARLKTTGGNKDASLEID
ncbi:hypothetical protein AG1IA_05827 [Rhizoctonia solani AG-1 IA]|uniref:Uncharacterized protein n=1 Tax=Thanatephorus cucumeris (strain AG1-IA) TaxID=983506 RepID=L8WTQ3_THACA|nr:hypothetical protein AG1IA_05827 [Rhizoctonia solani AG-1 IA]